MAYYQTSNVILRSSLAGKKIVLDQKPTLQREQVVGSSHTKKLGKNLPDIGIRDMIDSTKGKEKEFEKVLLNLLQAEKVPSNLSLFGAPPV